ncbi:MAG TPA: hypothetical protein VMW67_03825 [Desulfobacteria bacterium]|nr:hypothetical protein [Desulfobacteria bacterium]
MINNKTDGKHRDSLFDELIKMAREIRKETEDEIPEEDYVTWVEHHLNWIDLSGPFMSSLSEFDKFNGLLFFRFVELTKQLFWLHFSVLSGNYHQSIRELRYILESALQAYYIDGEHLEATMGCKLEIIRALDKLIGGRLIDRTDLEHKKELKVLYSDLSKYVHSSYEELRPTIEKGEIDYRFTLAFNKELFYKCMEFTNRVMDIFFFMILSLHPEVIPTIKENQQLLRSLDETKCILSVTFIEKYSDNGD